MEAHDYTHLADCEVYGLASLVAAIQRRLRCAWLARAVNMNGALTDEQRRIYSELRDETEQSELRNLELAESYFRLSKLYPKHELKKTLAQTMRELSMWDGEGVPPEFVEN